MLSRVFAQMLSIGAVYRKAGGYKTWSRQLSGLQSISSPAFCSM